MRKSEHYKKAYDEERAKINAQTNETIKGIFTQCGCILAIPIFIILIFIVLFRMFC